MWRQQTTPAEITPAILQFCKPLGPEDPFYIPHVKIEWARAQWCYGNVLEAIKRAQGKMILGWKIWEFPNMWLEAEHHAVWQHPDGRIVDITPQLEGEKILLFCRGSDQTYTGHSVSSVRYALRDKKLMEELWFVSDRIRDLRTQSQYCGISLDSQELNERIRPFAKRMFAIYEALGVNVSDMM